MRVVEIPLIKRLESCVVSRPARVWVHRLPGLPQVAPDVLQTHHLLSPIRPQLPRDGMGYYPRDRNCRSRWLLCSPKKYVSSGVRKSGQDSNSRQHPAKIVLWAKTIFQFYHTWLQIYFRTWVHSQKFSGLHIYIDLVIKKRKQLIQRSSHIYHLHFSRFREGCPDFVSGYFRMTNTTCNEKYI